MSQILDTNLNIEESEKALNLKIDKFLGEFNPHEIDDVAFRSARFDAG